MNPIVSPVEAKREDENRISFLLELKEQSSNIALTILVLRVDIDVLRDVDHSNLLCRDGRSKELASSKEKERHGPSRRSTYDLGLFTAKGLVSDVEVVQSVAQRTDYGSTRDR